MHADVTSSRAGEVSMGADYIDGAAAYSSEFITATSVRRGVSFQCQTGRSSGGYANSGWNSKKLALTSAADLSTQIAYGNLDFYVWCAAH